MQIEMVEESLLQVVLEECGRITGVRMELDSAWPDRSFQHLGIDSVGLYELQFSIEARLGILLADSSLLENPTPRQLVRLLIRSEAVGVPSREGG